MSDQKKPVFDEQTLGKLLEAAYILQEHNRERRKEPSREVTPKAPEQAPPKIPSSASVIANAPAPTPASQHDYQTVLEKVVEAQQRIQAGHLSRQSSLTLLAEQALEVAHGSGASIAFLDGEDMHYEAVAGITMMPTGAVIPVDDAICAIAVRTGEAFRCAEINPAILPDIEECRRSGVQAFVAVPIFLQDNVTGALELYYSQPQSFSEQDVHACQLIAGLVAGIPARDGQPTAKSAAAATAATVNTGPPSVIKVSTQSSKGTFTATALCQNCGHELLEHEQFCVECGARRTSYELPKLTTATTQAQTESAASDREFASSVQTSSDGQHDLAWAVSLKNQIPELFAEAEIPPHADLELSEAETPHTEISVTKEEPAEPEPAENGVIAGEAAASESVALAKPPLAADWSSASSAREYFEQLAGTHRRNLIARLWNERRGDIYLAIAVVLIAIVIRWGIWSRPAVNATAAPPKGNAAHQKSPDSGLSPFDRLLISLGLAEAPEPPADKGNPSTQVWVDLRTALYYCPGADLYGKTASGKYATQRDAQLDSFEPAYRKVCP